MALLDRDVTCMLVTGKPGASKSYQAVATVVDRFLPHFPGRVLTNLPIKREAVEQYLAKRIGKDEAAEYASRITVTTDDEAKRLYDQTLSVVGWFKAIEDRENEAYRAAAVEAGLDPDDESTAIALAKPRHPLEGAIVVIDEMGKLYPSGCEAKKVAEFAALLAVLRHHQAKIVFLSQDMMQVDAKIRRLNEYVLYVTPFHVGRIFVLGIEWSVVFEVRAWLTGYYRQGAYVQEAIQGFGDKLELQPDILPVVLRKEIFALYDTSNRPGQKAAPLIPPRYKRLKPLVFWRWVLEEAGYPIGWRAAAIVLLVITFGPWGWFWWAIPHAATACQGFISSTLTSSFQGEEKKQGSKKAVEKKADATTEGQGGKVEKITPQAQRQNELDGVNLQKLNAILDELAASRQRIADYESLLGGEKRFVATVGNTAITADGESGNVGDTIKSGVFEGRKILVVRAGLVGLDDGSVYRVRRPAKLSGANNPQNRANVSNGSAPSLPSPVLANPSGSDEERRTPSPGGVGSGVDAGIDSPRTGEPTLAPRRSW